MVICVFQYIFYYKILIETRDCRWCKEKSRMQLQRLLVILGILLVLTLLACCQSAGKITFQDTGIEHQVDEQGKIFCLLKFVKRHVIFYAKYTRQWQDKPDIYK